MKPKLTSVALAGVVCAMMLTASCTTGQTAGLKRETGESVVLVGEQPAALAWLPARGVPLRARSTYLPSSNTVDYAEGQDFVVDYLNGTLARARQSRIPDFQTNMLYGQESFDHARFPGFGNDQFFVYVDYSLPTATAWPVQPPQVKFLRNTEMKLKKGGPFRIIAFGDSITAGSNVSKAEDIFWQRWAGDLEHCHPQAQITVLNRATGGDTSTQGLERLKAKVLDEHPDLVLIGFGMNDHNVPKFGVTVEQFEQNLETMVARIRQETSAEVILYSAFPPNPKWKFGSHHMADYAAATERVAHRLSCAYADVFDNWQLLASRKKPEDLLANDINHPNDFGHWIYYRVFCSIGLTASDRP